VYNYEAQQLIKAPIDGVTVAKWHPRKKHMILYGTTSSDVNFYNYTDPDSVKTSFDHPGYQFVIADMSLNINLESSSNSVVDIAPSHGEDVFIVAYGSNAMFLFSEAEH
jgi:hypothetical protein